MTVAPPRRLGAGRPPTPINELPPIARRLRKALDGRTQSWLSDQTGISVRAISFWMTGDRKPSLDSVETIAKTLQVSPGWLAFGEER